MTDHDWPMADFDPVRRLRVVAATTKGASIHETVLLASVERVWAVASDLEGELPAWLFPDIRSVQLMATDDTERLVALARGHSGLRARFDVVMRPGWCLMQSRCLIGAMAVSAEGSGTRFALLSGFRGPMQRLSPVTRPLLEVLGPRALSRFANRVARRQDSTGRADG